MSPLDSLSYRVNARPGRCRLAIVTGLVLFVVPTVSRAQVPAPLAEPVIGVEEVWQLVLVEPDGGVYSPQFTTVMSPTGDLDSFYVQVSWNYREFPDFTPGGYQVQAWNDDQLLRLRDDPEDVFNDQLEVTVWTQTMATFGCGIAFAVFDGQSTSWGLFGGPDTVVSDNIAMWNLDNYSPDVSVRNTCITYGANRVALLMIAEVRYYGPESGLLYVDTTPRVAYAMDQGQ